MENDLQNTASTPRSFIVSFRSWKFWKTVLGIIAGAIAGFAVYYFIGCSGGSCPITSSPTISILWGAVMGFLLSR
jgi:H+/Cl- antiporter ClcA